MELLLGLLVAVLLAAGIIIGLYAFKRYKQRSAVLEKPQVVVAGARFRDIPFSGNLSTVSLGKRMEFYSVGRDRGFRLRELASMLHVLRMLGLEQPAQFLTNSKVLDHYLSVLLEKKWRMILLEHPDLQALAFKLMEYRMGQEKTRPKRQKGLDSTRTLAEGQIIKILFRGKIMFMAKVCDIGRTFLRVQVVQGKVPSGFSFKGQRAEIWFWRTDDAMYQFDSLVLEEPEKNAFMPVLSLRHSDHLVRMQKRSSLRARVLRDGEIIPLSGMELANESWQPGQGFPCRILDISETGAAIIVRGKVVPGVIAKIQLEVDDGALVMCGEIRSADLKPSHGISILHMEAIPLSNWMRTLVMAYVLGLVKHGDSPAPKKIDDSRDAGGNEGATEFDENMLDPPVQSGTPDFPLPEGTVFQQVSGSDHEPRLPREE